MQKLIKKAESIYTAACVLRFRLEEAALMADASRAGRRNTCSPWFLYEAQESTMTAWLKSSSSGVTVL